MLTKLCLKLDVVGQLAAASSKFVVVVNHAATPPAAPAEGQTEADAAANGMKPEHIGLILYDRTVYSEPQTPFAYAYLSTDIPSQVHMNAKGSHVAAISNEGRTLTIWKVEGMESGTDKLAYHRMSRTFRKPIDAFAFDYMGGQYAVVTDNRLYVFSLDVDDATACDDDVPSKIDSLMFADEASVLISADGKTRLLGIKRQPA